MTNTVDTKPFEWTDELVKEFVATVWTNSEKCSNNPEKFLQYFKQSKSIPNKQESKEDLVAAFIEKYRHDHTMTSHRIAAHIMGKFNTVPDISLKYTQSEVDTIREETWEAAKEKDVNNERWKGMMQTSDGLQCVYYDKYPTLQDYLNSLSKPSTTPIEDKTNMDIKSYTDGYQMGYTTALKYSTQPQNTDTKDK